MLTAAVANDRSSRALERPQSCQAIVKPHWYRAKLDRSRVSDKVHEPTKFPHAKRTIRASGQGYRPDHRSVEVSVGGCHPLNDFAPSKIANGCEAHELVDLFNEFCRWLDLSWQALLLSTFSRSFPNLSPLITCKQVFADEGKMATIYST